MNKIKKAIPFIFPPLITAAIILYVFNLNGLYPFGNGTISWCDMTQQVVPLLMDFKDILNGNDGLLLNMHNAGGMNFLGVFFFFLSNPFSFLVAFVEKENMILFVNILVILKLSLSALTASIYFKTRKKKLDWGYIILLSVMYSLCGYGLLFYQNIMWLDMMYLFPLLMIGLESLIEKKNNIFYTVILSLMMVTNYYICYMVAIFILIYMAVYLFSVRKKKETSTICLKFFLGTIISALMTTFVWFTSYIQVSSSGRGKSIIDNFSNTKFLSNYETVLPLLFCTALIFVIVIANALNGRKRNFSQNRNLTLFALTLIPFIIEPINLIWHTGDYMSFPARYGFITIFSGLICCADFLANLDDKDNVITLKNMKTKNYVSVFLCAGLVIWYFIYSNNYIKSHFLDLTKYTSTLWGDKTSLDKLAKLFAVTLVCYSILYIFYRKKLLFKQVFIIFLAVICLGESIGNLDIYMTSAYLQNDSRTQTFQNITALSDKISDDDFYRVMTDSKITDYNMIGAMGYNSLSHYTSLTNRDFMFNQKRLGYTTVWMEVGSLGGTELTNGLYSAKYKILKGIPTQNSVYSANGFTIEKQPYYLGLGIVTANDFSNNEFIPDNISRAKVQQYVFSSIYGNDKKLITEYDYDKYSCFGVDYTNGKYNITNGASIKYNIHVTGKQSLYADCFDRFSNSLSEPYFDKLSVYVNGQTIESKYPNKTNNGVLKLGEFENEYVTVEINSNSFFSCYSFGVFGLDLNMLKENFNSTECANLHFNGGKITGNVISDGTKSCLLALPYSDDLIVKINGEKVEAHRALSDYTVFSLKDGSNNIEISLIPKGFIFGITVSIVGVVLLILYIIFRKKIRLNDRFEKISGKILCWLIWGSVILIYALPFVISILEITNT